jgi:phthalate 4,5-cis-dihydrodiol dehydrogenase
MTENYRQIGLGIIGLGRAFTLMLPTFVRDDRFRMVAASTPGRDGREAFERDFGGRAYDNVNALCADPGVEVIYIASPHQFHCEHTAIAAAAGRHVLVDKPLAISVDEGLRMVAATKSAGVHLIVGPSHSFDAPVLMARKIIESGEFGKVRMIHALNYTDFLYRPRRPEELDTSLGGGVIFSQAIHQIDVVRLLAGGLASRVHALTGNWDPTRQTEGAYSALAEFQGGAFASLVYSGYGHFDSDQFMDWVGELGRKKDPDKYGGARQLLKSSNSPQTEKTLKRSRNYGYADTSSFLDVPDTDAHEHFGVVIVSCERADLRLKADGVMVYADHSRDFVPVEPPTVPRLEVMDELHDAVVHNKPPLHSGAWGLASVEVAVALIESATTRQPVDLHLQIQSRPQTSEE